MQTKQHSLFLPRDKEPSIVSLFQKVYLSIPLPSEQSYFLKPPQDIFRNDTLFSKFQFQPRRITTDNIKSISEPKYFEEFQHRMEEMIAFCQLVHNLEAQRIIKKSSRLSLYLRQDFLLYSCVQSQISSSVR